MRLGRERLRQILVAESITFQRTKTWNESPDPLKEAKLARIEWLFEHARERTFAFGPPAVIAFFVISGFLITNLSLRRWGSLERVDVRQFYWMRFARIAPCLLLLVALLSFLHLVEAQGFVINPDRSSGFERQHHAAMIAAIARCPTNQPMTGPAAA